MHRVLLLIPVVLVAAAVGVWSWQTFVKKPDPGPAPPEVHLKTETAAGITFEVEHELREGVNLLITQDTDWIEFVRRNDLLDYADGVLTLNGLGFPGPKAGDVVRWNLDGSLLVNGAPVQPHPIQPLPLTTPPTNMQWDHRGNSPSPRDSLSVGWPKSGRVLVAAHGDGVVRVWDADREVVTANLFHEPPKEGGHGSWGVRASISPDGKTVATANIHAPDLILWDVATATKRVTLSFQDGNVRNVQFLTDEWLLEVRGKKLYARQATGDLSNRIVGGFAVVDLGDVPEQFETPFAVSGDGKTLVRNDGTKAILGRIEAVQGHFMWKATGVAIEKLSGDAVMALSHDGSLLAVFTGGARVNRLLTLYDTATGAVRQHLRWRADPEGLNQATAMCFLPDGKTLAVGELKSVRLYDLDSGRERGWVPAGWVRALAASPDGKTLAAATRYESGLRLWDIASLK